MKDYYQQSIKLLQLAGLSERTQHCYTRSVRQLVGRMRDVHEFIN